MGDGHISNSVRERLERDLDNLQSSLKSRNESHKPVEAKIPDGARMPVEYDDLDMSNRQKNVRADLIAGGATAGNDLYGPVGAFFGGVAGAIISLFN